MKNSIYNNLYECNNEELSKKLEQLRTLILVMDSNLPRVEKMKKFYMLFRNSEEFKKSFILIKKYGKNDSLFEEAIKRYDDICNLYKEYEKDELWPIIKHYLKNQHYFELYNYSEFIINNYINDYGINNFNEFYNKYGINNDYFLYCVDVIRVLNDDLYYKFVEKYDYDNKRFFRMILDSLISIGNAIRTGYFEDGTELSVLEFWKRIPFIENSEEQVDVVKTQIPSLSLGYTYWNRVSRFIRNFLPEYLKDYENYCKENYLFKIVLINEEDLNKNFARINNKTLTIDDNKIILNYIKFNKLPMIMEVYDILAKMYINNEIDIEKYKNIKIKEDIIPILIP